MDHREGRIVYKAHLSFITHEIVCSQEVTHSSGFNIEVSLKELVSL